MVDAVLAGDLDAYRVLVDREGSGLVRACQRVLGDLHEAEDAAQEAFVLAFRALPGWRGEGSFGAWLARIGVRLALRRLAARRRVTWIETDAPDHGRTGRTGGVPAPREVVAPEMVVIAAERAGEVRAAVAGLDDPYREVVALRFFGECSIAEIAAVTGRPVPTVKTQLRRGLLRLRTSLSEDRRSDAVSSAARLSERGSEDA